MCYGVEWIKGFGKRRRLSNSGIISKFAWRRGELNVASNATEIRNIKELNTITSN
jgi:hypothetical protein